VNAHAVVFCTEKMYCICPYTTPFEERMSLLSTPCSTEHA
jgi:hypothetical protein